MEPNEIIQELERMDKTIQDLGDVWAKAKAQYEFKEKMEKTELARLMGESLAKSQSAKEQEARCHLDYLGFLKELEVLREKYLLAQVQYEAAKVKNDNLRSLLSMEKTKVGMF